MNKIRILHIIPELNGGGVASTLLHYLECIDMNQFEMDVIAYKSEVHQMWEQSFVERGVNVIYVTPRTESIKKHFEDVKMNMRKGYDIMHCHMSDWSVVYALVAKQCDIPVRIGHAHASANEYSLIKRCIIKCINLMFKSACTDYFACGKAAAIYLWGKQKYESNSVYIMNNAVSIQDFSYTEKTRFEMRNLLGINTDTIVIGHIGRFCETKNQRFVVEIYKELFLKKTDSLLLFVGDGEMRTEIENLVAKYDLQEHVRFFGLRDDVNKLLSVLDVLLLPSLNEGLPVVAVEAQVNGLPMLMSDGVPEETLIMENCKRISLKESPKAWAGYIIEQLEKGRLLGVNTMQSSGYDISIEAKKLEQEYQQMWKRGNS